MLQWIWSLITVERKTTWSCWDFVFWDSKFDINPPTGNYANEWQLHSPSGRIKGWILLRVGWRYNGHQVGAILSVDARIPYLSGQKLFDHVSREKIYNFGSQERYFHPSGQRSLMILLCLCLKFEAWQLRVVRAHFSRWKSMDFQIIQKKFQNGGPIWNFAHIIDLILFSVR